MDPSRQCINGRQYLGNTPTVIAGTRTKMRFGVVAMANTTVHTFHLHGHRWVLPGPAGGKVGGEPPGPHPGNGVQVSPLQRAVSQFEDTKVFGAGNSFVFTVNEGSLFGPPLGDSIGEWHMHCHLLGHMSEPHGMMGSLLVVGDKERRDRFFQDVHVQGTGDH
jgi:hypothetical protein